MATRRTESLLLVNFGDEISEVVLTGFTAPFEMMLNSDSTLFFLLSFMVIVAAFDFSAGTVKNVLASGTSRAKLYISKLALSLLLCFILSLLAITVSTASATIIRGFGGIFDFAFIGSVARAFGAQLLILFAITCVGMFFVFTTKNVVAFIGLYLAFGLIPQFLLAFIVSFNDNLTFLFNFDLWGSAVRSVNIDLMILPEAVMLILSGVVCIFFSTIGGILLFKRSEVK